MADTPADTLANDKLYKAEYVGSGTFLISKPKRKKTKQRQSNLKNINARIAQIAGLGSDFFDDSVSQFSADWGRLPSYKLQE